MEINIEPALTSQNPKKLRFVIIILSFIVLALLFALGILLFKPATLNSPLLSDGEVEINNGILSMDSVRLLAHGSISPFDFMEEFPGTIVDGNPVVYYAVLPDKYVVRIEYSGDTVNYVHLEDHISNQYIDLRKHSIDDFLLQRK